MSPGIFGVRGAPGDVGYRDPGTLCDYRPQTPCIGGRSIPCYITDCTASLAAPGTIALALNRLFTELEAAAMSATGDEWIASQRVHYLSAAGLHDAALSVARCGSTLRCRLLEVFALHRLGRTTEAAGSLTSALAVADRDTGCALMDVSALLPDSLRSAYRRMPCGSDEREEFERRFWHLSDPSWIVDGNDRRLEHIARVLEAAIQSEYGGINYGIDRKGKIQLATDSLSWVLHGANDSYWIESPQGDWDRAPRGPVYHPPEPGIGCQPGEGVVTITRDSLKQDWTASAYVVVRGTRNQKASQCNRGVSIRSRYHFVPSAGALASPDSAGAEDWALEQDRLRSVKDAGSPYMSRPMAPRVEHYTPSYGQISEAISNWQVARFWRRDSTMIVAAMRTSSNELLETAVRGTPQTSLRTGMIVNSDTSVLHIAPLVRSANYERQWYGTITVPRLTLFGLEVLANVGADSTSDGDTSYLGRVRHALSPLEVSPKTPTISDLLLYRGSVGRVSSPVDSGSALIAAALPSADLSAESSVGIYWELYGLAPSDTVDYTLSVIATRLNESMKDRLRNLFWRQPYTPVAIRWRTFAPDSSRAYRVESVLVNTTDIPPGDYVLELRAVARGAVVTTRRPLMVTQPRP